MGQLAKLAEAFILPNTPIVGLGDLGRNEQNARDGMGTDLKGKVDGNGCAAQRTDLLPTDSGR